MPSHAFRAAFSAMVALGGDVQDPAGIHRSSRMLIEVFGLNPNVSAPAAAVIVLAMGLLVAGLAEYLWEMERVQG
jgi:hypothetical protein